ncbi:MAG: glycine betaine ABC transporter substrate-binding protein [Rhizonema sp. NSF051]|nr:glycine betaine ABC transporter substrate-binding protein [Rhizonema sp. NSF051]
MHTNPTENVSLETIVLGRIDESFYQATAAVLTHVLNRLGHVVNVIDGTHTEVYNAIGEAKVDLCVAFWLPEGHAEAWRRLRENVEELSVLFYGAHFFWAVPEYVPVEAVQSIGDLAKPEVVVRMPKTLRGLSLDATITTASQKVLKEYELDQQGYVLVPGSYADWKSSLIQAQAARNWTVIPLWQPYYFNQLYHLRPLDDPKHLLGGVNRAVLAAHRNVRKRLPTKTLEVLARMRLDITAVTDIDYSINMNGKTPEEAAEDWILSNTALVNAWFAGVR